MRDNHQTWDFTKSISPPFKRRKEQKQDDTLEYVKNASDGINMEFEELISELEDMNLVEEKTRSDQMDKKILEKKEKKNDLEEESRKKSENEPKVKRKIEKISLDKSNEKKSKECVGGNNGKTHKTEKTDQIKTEKRGVSILEEKYWNLVGENRFKVGTISDGTYQADANSAALLCFKDPEVKRQVVEEENKYLIQNFSILHKVKIGVGKEIEFKDEETFKTFLA